MAKRLIYRFVKESFEKEGYTFLTKTYKNSRQKLEYICCNNHRHCISWDGWKSGSRCPYCVGLGKLTTKFIKTEFEKENYKFLTKTYKNCEQKLDYICPKGHKHNISWSHWQRGRRCPYCAGQGKPTIEFIRSEFKKEGYTLLTTEYKNNSQKLDYICPKGHYHNISWAHWRSGKRCFYCVGNVPPSIHFIKREFEKENYVLLTKRYRNNTQKLKYICPKGHKHFISWGHWQQGQRCPTCSHVKQSIAVSGKNHWNWKGGVACEPYCDIWLDKDFKESIKQRDGYRCMNPYCNSKNLRDLTIHHIDYNKKNCRSENLITVCRSCNVRANTDREWHEAWYKAILHKRYGI